MPKILVTGGCGYIGSHTIVNLLEEGFEVVSVDNLVNSDDQVMEGIKAITGKQLDFYCVDLCNLEATRQIFEAEAPIAGVVHFAALKFVGESVERPLDYYQNNLNSLLNVVQCMQEFSVPHIIFSSSCSVYGNATDLPVTEETPFQEAESPYARTKQIGEYFLKDYARSQAGFHAVILRYFNPAGAHPSALIGESPVNPASNLVPVITETAIGKRPELTIFGNDYPTRDGSCVRDFIHVMDLANAHTKALQYLMQGNNSQNLEVFNLGIGQGVTVLEAVHAFQKATGRTLAYKIGPRRPGDVIAIYADNQKTTRILGWQPQYGIEEIMETAWRWEQKRVADNNR